SVVSLPSCSWPPWRTSMVWTSRRTSRWRSTCTWPQPTGANRGWSTSSGSTRCSRSVSRSREAGCWSPSDPGWASRSVTRHAPGPRTPPRSGGGKVPAMDPAAEPIDRGSARGLTGELVLRLTEQIQDGTIRKGEKLPTESALMEAYQVSRTVVREAISQLRASGLVETQQGRGSFVLTAPSSEQFALDPTEIRTVDDV